MLLVNITYICKSLLFCPDNQHYYYKQLPAFALQAALSQYDIVKSVLGQTLPEPIQSIRYAGIRSVEINAEIEVRVAADYCTAVRLQTR